MKCEPPRATYPVEFEVTFSLVRFTVFVLNGGKLLPLWHNIIEVILERNESVIADDAPDVALRDYSR